MSVDQPLRNNPNKLVWEQGDVSANLSKPQTVGASVFYTTENLRLIPGTMSLRERNSLICVEWHSDAADLPDWVVTDSVAFNNTGSYSPKDDESTESFEHMNGESTGTSPDSPSPLGKRINFTAPLSELRSFKLRSWERDGIHQAECQFHLKDGSSSTPFLFLKGGSSTMTETLQRYVTLKRSTRDNDLILVSDLKADLLEKSVAALLDDKSGDFISRMVNNPYGTAMSSLGRVTNFFADRVVPLLVGDDDFSTVDQEEAMERMMALQREAEKLHISHQDSFQLVSKEFELPPRPDVPRGEVVTEVVWKTYLNAEGCVPAKKERELKHTIFRGCVADSLRPLLWKYLLDYYPFSATSNEIEELKKKKTAKYELIKKQWQSIDEDQENRFAAFRDRKALIEKDVMRTDRSYVKPGTEGEHLRVLNDILMTYSMYNFDLGYVQGMSDLLSPVLVVVEDEVDSFWCFVGFMQRIYRNFEMDQQHIKTQLMHLRDLLMIVKPEFLNYLEGQDSDNMFFCFRWILIWFKREFTFDDIKSLWEIFWTEMPCKNFHLLFCIAVLDSQSNFIVDNNYGFTEILKHMNELALNIDFLLHVRIAEGIYHQLAAVQDKLPPHICEILGFSLPADRHGSTAITESLATASGDTSLEQI